MNRVRNGFSKTTAGLWWLVQQRRFQAAALLVGLAAGAWFQFVQTFRYDVVHSGVLYRSGMRGERQFVNGLRKAQPKVVVSLLSPNELKEAPYKGERTLCESRGIRWVHIPLGHGTWPTTDEVRQFLDLVERPENQPVLVHCAQGIIRTGFMVGAYQRSVEKKGVDQALASIRMFDRPARKGWPVESFVRNYQADARVVPPRPNDRPDWAGPPRGQVAAVERGD